MGWSTLDRRVQRLEQRQQQSGSNDPPGRWWELLVAPSCPPDKRLQIRSGTVSTAGHWGWIMQNDFVPDMVCDFESEEETDLDLVFTNVGYYMPIILCYAGDWASGGGDIEDPPYFDSVVGIEAATSTGAEAQIDAWLNGSTQWYYYRVPLWGVVLKNNGQIDLSYAIEPVDAVNRGRSYLYRDCRARHNMFG